MCVKLIRLFPIGRIGAGLAATAVALSVILADAGARAQSDVLKPEVRYDVLKHRLETAARQGRHRDTVSILAQMRATRFGVTGEALFYEGQAHFQLENWTAAHSALVSYLNSVGRKARNYKAAVALYVQTEAKIKELRRRAEELARAERGWEIAASAYDIAKRRRDTWKSKVITFGGEKNDMAWAMARRVGGGFIVGGTFEQVEDKPRGREPGRRLWLAAIDIQGRMVWNQVLGVVAKDGSVRMLSPLADGGFLVGGIHAGFQIAARVDSNGAVISDRHGDPWINAYARSKDGAGGIVVAPGNGNFVAVGAESVDKDGKRARLPFTVRLSGTGETLGKTIYTGEAMRFWHDMTEATALPRGDVLAIGESRAQGSGDARAGMGYLLRVSAEGKLVFSRRIRPEGKGGMRLSAVAPAIGGGAIVAGHEGNRLVILKVKEDGSRSWRKTLPPRSIMPQGAEELCTIPQAVERVQESQRRRNRPVPNAERIAAVRALACKAGTPFASAAHIVPREGGYLILAFQGHGTRERTEIRLIAIDEDGAIVWDRIYGHDGFDLAAAALATEDGGFIIAGATDSVGAGGRDFLLFKIDASGHFAPWAKLGPPREGAPPAKTATKEAAPGAKPIPRPAEAKASASDKKAEEQESGDQRGEHGGAEYGPGKGGASDSGGEPDEGSGSLTSSAAPESGNPPETSFGSLFDWVFGGNDEDGSEAQD